MKRNILLFIGFLFVGTQMFSQSITLQDCQTKAKENYPLIHKQKLIEASQQYSLDNIGKRYLPQVSFNAQATYQSEVTKLNLPISIPGVEIPSMSKDQYKATIDVSQIVWDGGNISSNKQLIKANAEVESQSNGVSLYAINERINQLYFGILALDEQNKQLDLLFTDLNNGLSTVNSLLKNGVAMPSDVDLIKVEILNAEQKRIELKSNREAFLKILSIFTGQSLSNETILAKPENGYRGGADIYRPELDLFKKQRSFLQTQEKQVDAKNMPVIGLFAQGGYGRPGLNMLEDKFKMFAIGGVKLTWNFGNLYTKSGEKQQLKVSKSLVDMQEEVFRFNTNLQMSQIETDIAKYDKLVAKDNEIISLRYKVKMAAESKYKNGIYTMNDFIRDINAENQSRQLKSLHEIQQLMSIYNYKYTQGNN